MPGEFYLSWLWHPVGHQGLGWSLHGALSFGGVQQVPWHGSVLLLGWMCCCPWGREEGRGCQHCPSPATQTWGMGWVSRGWSASCIPRLLTHNSLSWVTILSLWLCYHFLVGFVHFLSSGSTLWAEQCESDKGINVTFRKKSIVGKHLYFNKGTFDLKGFPIQIRSRAPEQLCQQKRGAAHHGGWMGVRGKFGSGKKMPVAPKVGQAGITIPYIYQSDWNGTKWVPGFLYFRSCSK